MDSSRFDLHISQSPTARVTRLAQDSWHLELPANDHRGYLLAQLDDHNSLRRQDFPWRPPLKLSLWARVSAPDIPGTWGFGLWNDPFSFLLSYNKVVPRFPTLPEAAWFFHASANNYLSFRDDIPANGFMAATFSSKRVPTIGLGLASPILVLTLIPGTAQLVRNLLRHPVRQDAFQIHTSVAEWHAYGMEWLDGQVSFTLDGVNIMRTNIAPNGPLSLVIWVDNQYASLPPRGRLRYGTLPNPEPAWLEIKEFIIKEISSG
jgi:hypothetical protein